MSTSRNTPSSASHSPQQHQPLDAASITNNGVNANNDSQQSSLESLVEPLIDATETCKSAIAQGAHVILSNIPGTAEHTVKKAADEFKRPDDDRGVNEYMESIDAGTTDIHIATGKPLKKGGVTVERHQPDYNN